MIRLIRNAKQISYCHLSEKMGSPGSILSKEWWKLCKYRYIGRDSDHSIPQLTTDNNIFKDTDQAEAFNDYFNSISQVTDANAAIDEPITSTDYVCLFVCFGFNVALKHLRSYHDGACL